tara:strand:+ start:1312 stop:2382 length:1071 start_codon:yes stop_codon:yes gene_type:complete
MKRKSLSAKKVIHNNFNFTKILRNKKILKIYKDFEKNFDNLNVLDKVAIAVSGGPDSMALCFLISCFKERKNKEIQPVFYLVDHGLREESSKEALQVKRQLKLKNINLNILKWKGKKPKSNVQNLARNKRYELLFNRCKKLNISTMLTAHHEDDLYETFFSRLLRGSGVEGLSSFVENEKKFIFEGKSIKIIRPLLEFNKKNLIYVSKHVFNFYVNDPSNEMDRFQRVRLRKFILDLRNQGLDLNKLKLTLNNLSSANKALNSIVEKNIIDNVIFYKNKCLINFNFFKLSNEIVFRSLSIIFKEISKKNYPPRGKKIINMIYKLKNKSRFKATLGGTIIEKIHNSVVVTVEKTKKR